MSADGSTGRMTRNCESCGTSFAPRSRYSRFCSTRCHRAHFPLPQPNQETALPESAFVVVKGPQFKGLFQIIEYAPGRLELPVWEAPTFNLLSLASLRGLPAVHDAAQICGVYFLWRGEELVYVGSSENAISRIRDHRKGGKIAFSASTYLYVRSPWHLSVEALYIIAYRPEYNVKHTPKPMKRKGQCS